MSKKHLLVTQIFMTFIMAATMSGIMGLIFTGPSLDWLAAWPLQFLLAWPIAFCVTMVAWPASMKLSGAVMAPRRATAEATSASQDAEPAKTPAAVSTR